MKSWAVLFAAIACAPAPMPVSHSSSDPSSPQAPEGASRPAPAHTHAHQASEPGDAGAVVYVCPMHPEVTSSRPETCPKCNMKLVPRK
jgi:hypothetical protein